MARIPFRALNRPLSGKNGRFNVRAAPVVAEAPDTSPDTSPEPVTEPVTEPEPATATEPESTTESAATPEWKPTWTKAQLLVVAQSKGLAVTAANSKAEIVAALTAAG